MAAFFHDISINNSLLMLTPGDPRDLEGLDPKVLREYLNHPYRSAEIVAAMPDVSPEIDQIIKLHHEKYDGSGFPGGIIGKKIFPLAVIMIVAEEFIDYMFRHKKEPGFARTCVDAMDEKYRDGHFAKAVESLRKALAIPKRYHNSKTSLKSDSDGFNSV